MAKISDSVLQKFKDELRNRINIVDVVSEHVVLRKSGANLGGLCPFHSERSPSFTVSEQKQMYHCFGCKKGGDLISFVREIHGLGFMEALEELSERASLPLPREFADPDLKDNPERAKKRAEERERLAQAQKLNRFAAAFFRDQIAQIPEARAYFQKRGILDPSSTSGLSRNFYLGASQAGWDSLARRLVQAKAPIPLAEQLGLIRPSQKGMGHFDLFRARAIFPIIDLRGKIVGFGGRSIPELAAGDQSKDAGPKYLNSPESFLFHKGKVAYGLYQAQKHIREQDEVILVEGYFDVLGLHAGGFENAVATCGTALTLDHFKLFQKLGKRLTLLFDSDRAGEEATERAMELGLENGQVFYGATLPPKVDPDEVIFDRQTGAVLPEGREQMKSILAAAKPLLDVRIEQSIREAAGGPEALTTSIKKIAGWLKIFSDPIGREIRIRSASQALGIEPRLLVGAVGATLSAGSPLQVVARGPGPSRPSAPSTPTRTRPMSKAERVVLAGLAWGGEFAEVLARTRAQLPPGMGLWELFEHPSARRWVEQVVSEPAVLARLRQAPETLIAAIDSRQVLATITEALVSREPPCPLEDFQKAIRRCLGQAWVRFSQHIKKALGAAEASQDAELQAKLMQEYVDVQRKIKELTAFYDEAD